MATVLVQNGTLRSGDMVIAGTAVGHVRAMTNDKGRSIKEAGPSVPVEITGLSEIPEAGDDLLRLWMSAWHGRWRTREDHVQRKRLSRLMQK